MINGLGRGTIYRAARAFILKRGLNDVSLKLIVGRKTIDGIATYPSFRKNFRPNIGSRYNGSTKRNEGIDRNDLWLITNGWTSDNGFTTEGIKAGDFRFVTLNALYIDLDDLGHFKLFTFAQVDVGLKLDKDAFAFCIEIHFC
jgi:hypothetical protein